MTERGKNEKKTEDGGPAGTVRPRDPWQHLGLATPARIALGRSGSALPTRAVLAFGLDHARARDAVHAELERHRLSEALQHMDLAPVLVESRATSRQHYLQRPDLGRRLEDGSLERLRAAGAADGHDLAIVVADGLSATAVESNALPVIEALLPHIDKLGMRLAPVAICRGARVGLGDAIGAALGAKMVAVLIGERPGLSSPDGMSIYLTFDPGPERTDADRNCISNIRGDGLAPAEAAGRLAWLIDQARALGKTGVALKDESGEAPLLDR